MMKDALQVEAVKVQRRRMDTSGAGSQKVELGSSQYGIDTPFRTDPGSNRRCYHFDLTSVSCASATTQISMGRNPS